MVIGLIVSLKNVKASHTAVQNLQSKIPDIAQWFQATPESPSNEIKRSGSKVQSIIAAAVSSPCSKDSPIVSEIYTVEIKKNGCPWSPYVTVMKAPVKVKML